MVYTCAFEAVGSPALSNRRHTVRSLASCPFRIISTCVSASGLFADRALLSACLFFLLEPLYTPVCTRREGRESPDLSEAQSRVLTEQKKDKRSPTSQEGDRRTPRRAAKKKTCNSPFISSTTILTSLSGKTRAQALFSLAASPGPC